MRFKRVSVQATIVDWIMAGVVFIAALLMIFSAAYNFIVADGNVSIAILFLVFGSICLWATGEDLLKFKKLTRGIQVKKPWIVAHIGKMGGAYIATCTAFFVVNINFLPPLVVWLTPSLIGTILLIRATKRYSPKRKAVD